MGVIKYLVGLLLFSLLACSGPIDVGPGLAKVSHQFSEAMRWRDYLGAAHFLQQDLRSTFLEQFQRDEDLYIVESRIININLNKADGTAEADYLLEYYRLPSSRVKKWRWLQQWQLCRGKITQPGIWQIINAPPPLP